MRPGVDPKAAQKLPRPKSCLWRGPKSCHSSMRTGHEQEGMRTKGAEREGDMPWFWALDQLRQRQYTASEAAEAQCPHIPPKDGKGFTISENLKSCQGPALICRGSRKRRAFYLNELVIHEIRNNASAIFQNFLFSCCKLEFVQCGKNPWSLYRPWVAPDKAADIEP